MKIRVLLSGRKSYSTLTFTLLLLLVAVASACLVIVEPFHQGPVLLAGLTFLGVLSCSLVTLIFPTLRQACIYEKEPIAILKRVLGILPHPQLINATGTIAIATDFVGRSYETAQLDDLLKIYGKAYVCGLQGIGKSQFALHYCHESARFYKTVVWINCANLESKIEDTELALDLDSKEIETRKLFKKFKSWIDSQEDTLLILENAESNHDIQDIVPAGLRSHVLVLANETPKSTTFPILKLPGLNASDGAALLLKRAATSTNEKNVENSAQWTDALEISNLLAGIPLGLVHAALYIQDRAMKIEDYKKLLTGKKLPDHAVDLNLDTVKDSKLSAWSILVLFSATAPVAVPKALFPQTEVLELDLRALERWSLISLQERNVLMHPFVKQVLNTKLTKDEQRAATETLLKRLVAVSVCFKNGEYMGPIKAYLPFAPHYQSASDSAIQAEIYTDDLFVVLDLLYSVQIRLAQLTEAYQTIVKTYDLRDKFTLTAEQLSGLESRVAVAYLQLGENDKAITFCENALENERKQRDSSSRLATMTMLLGDICNSSNDPLQASRAQQLFRQALQMFRREKAESKMIESALIKLAFLAWNSGNADEAWKLFNEVLNGRDPLSVDNADLQIGLAGFYRDFVSEKWDMAEQLYLAVVERAENELGQNHPAVAMRLANFATLLAKQPNRIAEVEPILERVLKIRTEQLPEGHYRTVEAMLSLSEFWLFIEKKDQAVRLLKLVIESEEIAGEIQGSSSLARLVLLGRLLDKADQFESAVPVMRKIIEYKQRMGTADTELLFDLTFLHRCCEQLGNAFEADKIAKQINEIPTPS
ncbi:hypothetical protein BH10CYA1_BH10CYA1_62550 [soil metagenome]